MTVILLFLPAFFLVGCVTQCHSGETRDCMVGKCPGTQNCVNSTWGNCVKSNPECGVTRTCSDGTPYGQCSTNKPKYCDNGTLIDNCSICSCSPNSICNTLGHCVVTECVSDSDCDDKNPNTIDVCQNQGTFYYNGSSAARCVHRLQAKGNLKIGIIEFAPKDALYSNLYYCYDKRIGYYLQKRTGYYLQNLKEYCTNIIEIHNFLEVFNNPEGQFKFEGLVEREKENNPHSVFYIDDFYLNEAKRYGADNFSLNISVLGPFSLDSNPPKRNSTMACDSTLRPFFEEEARKNSVDLTHYDIIAFVYFNDQVLSHREYNGFTPCKGKNNTIYVSIDISRVLEDNGVEAITHELAHVLGAHDKYLSPCPYGDHCGCCKIPDGIPEPNKIPLYPQEKACLMCGYIMLNEEGEGQNFGNLNKVVICPKTAEEIGWVD